MRIIIAGGTGFLGSALVRQFAAAGDAVRVLTRRRRPGNGGIFVEWTPDGNAGPWAGEVDGADAVINLAGEGIGDRRWTPERKAQLVSSRLLPTRSLAAAITAAARPPAVFISASGVGYYGAGGGETLTEAAAPGTDFLARLCIEWEAAALAAARPGVRAAVVRTGIVLDGSGGALARMLPPFRFFAGGPMGSGRQYMSWIHREDWISMVRWLVHEPRAAGPVNVTAPEPVTNREFATALGAALHRPALVSAPAFALKVLLGEMATPLLLTGQRAIPAKALALGFRFRHPELRAALADLLPAAGLERGRAS